MSGLPARGAEYVWPPSKEVCVAFRRRTAYFAARAARRSQRVLGSSRQDVHATYIMVMTTRRCCYRLAHTLPLRPPRLYESPQWQQLVVELEQQHVGETTRAAALAVALFCACLHMPDGSQPLQRQSSITPSLGQGSLVRRARLAVMYWVV